MIHNSTSSTDHSSYKRKGGKAKTVLKAIVLALNERSPKDLKASKVDVKTLRQGLQNGHSLGEQLTKYTSETPADLEKVITEKIKEIIVNPGRQEKSNAFVHKHFEEIMNAGNFKAYRELAKKHYNSE